MADSTPDLFKNTLEYRLSRNFFQKDHSRHFPRFSQACFFAPKRQSAESQSSSLAIDTGSSDATEVESGHDARPRTSNAHYSEACCGEGSDYPAVTHHRANPALSGGIGIIQNSSEWRFDALSLRTGNLRCAASPDGSPTERVSGSRHENSVFRQDPCWEAKGSGSIRRHMTCSIAAP